MIRLTTPALALADMARGNDTPEQVQFLRDVREHLRERKMLDIAMSPTSIGDLMKEAGEKIIEAREAEERHVASFESHKPL